MYLNLEFGSMIIQLVVAAFAVCGTYLFIARDKVKKFFSKKKGTSDAAVADATQADAVVTDVSEEVKAEGKADAGV